VIRKSTLHFQSETEASGVSRIISPHDTMLDTGGLDAYFDIGKGALAHCKGALAGQLPGRILDYPCGYGRVMRWFRHEWPNAEIFGVETDGKCLDFVKENFGAVPLQADPRLKMTVPGDVDLIFSGSLLTHFDEWQWRIYLEICCSALAPEGVFLFTTHGRIASILARERHPVYGDLIDTRELFERQKASGFSYLPYDPAYPTFGISLSSPAWIMSLLERMANIKIIGFEEGGWGQDIWAVQRAPWPMAR
jgi:SAM-dependent methyltransferase